MCIVFWNLWTLLLAGLNKRTTSEKLQEAFSKFGEVVNGNIIFLKWCYLSFPLSLSLYTHTRTNACNFVEHALKILAMWRYFGVHGTLWCYLSKKKWNPLMLSLYHDLKFVTLKNLSQFHFRFVHSWFWHVFWLEQFFSVSQIFSHV